MMYSPIIAALTTLPLLSCYKVSSKQLLFADMSEECWSPIHTTYTYALVIPSLLLNFLIPIVVIVVCMKGRLTQYVTIWKSGYKFYYWELFLLTGRGIYTGVVIGTQATSQLLQICSGLIVLICICMTNVVMQPWVYQQSSFFFLSEASLVIVSISHGLTSYYVYYAPGNSWQDYLISVVFLVLNVGYAGLIMGFRAKNTLNQESRAEQQLPVPHNSLNLSFS